MRNSDDQVDSVERGAQCSHDEQTDAQDHRLTTGVRSSGTGGGVCTRPADDCHRRLNMLLLLLLLA